MIDGSFVPKSLLFNYKRLITEKELIILMMLRTTQPTKKGWEEVAEALEYDNIGPITRMIDSLEERNLVVKNKYNVDTTPLIAACEQPLPEVQPVYRKTTIEKENESIYYREARKVLEMSQYQNIHGLAKLLKKFNIQDAKPYYTAIVKTRNKVLKTKEEYLLGTILELEKEGVTLEQYIKRVHVAYKIKVKQAGGGMVYLPDSRRFAQNADWFKRDGRKKRITFDE